MIVAAALHDVGDRSAIDLKIENYVPSKVRGPQNDQTPTRLGSGPGRNRAHKDKNQNEYAGGGVSRLHGLMLPDSLLASAAVIAL